MSDAPAIPLVYFIQGQRSLNIKIGLSAEPFRRLSVLRIGNSEPLDLIAVYRTDDAAAVEKGLHRRFWSLRVCGEWFQPNAELRQFIREHCESAAPMIAERQAATKAKRSARRRIEDYSSCSWGDEPEAVEAPAAPQPEMVRAPLPKIKERPMSAKLRRYFAERGMLIQNTEAT